MSLSRQLYAIFFEGCTHYALGYINSDGDVAYRPVEGVPTLKLIEEHLAGEVTLGAYTILPGNTVRWMAFDVDSKTDPEKAKEIAKKLSDYLGTIPHAVSWSGGKGYHIDIFFSTTYPSKEVKAVGDAIRDILSLAKSGDPHVEVFPKQGELTKSNPLGSLLRLPLGLHPSTKNRSKFVDPKNDWQELEPEKLLEQRADLKDLQRRLNSGDSTERLVGILARYWLPGHRHDMALWTAGHLSTLGWTEEAVNKLIEDIHAEVGEGNLGEWQRAVRDTFTKVYAGKAVVGSAGLARILSQEALSEVIDIASKQVSSTTLKMIDAIRLGKDTAWQKVRTAAKTVISFFRENGSLVRDTNSTYWLNEESRNLLVIDGPDWDRFNHNQFGLNPQESFGRQTAEAVKLLAYDAAEVVQVQRRSWYDTDKDIMWLSLGGSIVYRFNGNPAERQAALNGDNKILFLNMDDPLVVPNLLEESSKVLDPWPFLANDINFASKDEVSATPVQQRELLKALIISILFSNMLPTRPILAILGVSNSGKTTVMRRILRLFEGPDAEVLSVNDDKPDSFRSSLVAHKVLALDNMEENKAPWMPDMLNRVSTGAHIELRVLHTTNKVQVLKPDCNVLLTSTHLPFAKETVYSRLLPLQLVKLPKMRPEDHYKQEIAKNFTGLWKGMFDVIDEVVAELKRVKMVEGMSDSRLADFSVFCARIQGASFLDGKELMKGLAGLVSRQEEVLYSESRLIAPLEYWLRTRVEDGGKWWTLSELFPVLQRSAMTNRLPWEWINAQGLSRHMTTVESTITIKFGMEKKKGKERGREVDLYRFPAKSSKEKVM